MGRYRRKGNKFNGSDPDPNPPGKTAPKAGASRPTSLTAVADDVPVPNDPYSAWAAKQGSLDDEHTPEWAQGARSKWLEGSGDYTHHDPDYVMYQEEPQDMLEQSSRFAPITVVKQESRALLRAEKVGSGTDEDGNEVDLYRVPTLKSDGQVSAIKHTKTLMPSYEIGSLPESGTPNLTDFVPDDQRYLTATSRRLENHSGLNVLGEANNIDELDAHVATGSDGTPLALETYTISEQWDPETGDAPYYFDDFDEDAYFTRRYGD